MPELPEVETIARCLRTHIVGETLRDILVFWPATVEGDPKLFRRAFRHRTITSVERRGKYLIVDTDGDFRLSMHLRMSGKLTFQLDERDGKHLRIQFKFHSQRSLFFVDIRKFGRIRLWTKQEPLLPRLGREPLASQDILNTLGNLSSRRTIKGLLLDQRVLAGLGNIYVDEILYRAGIHPATPLPRLGRRAITRIAEITPALLMKAIDNGGTTLVNYRPPDRPQGNNQYFLQVYGRTGQPCHRCGTKIQRQRVAGRSSHFCPRCQK